MTGYSTGTAHIRELGEAAERLVPGIPALDPAAGRNWRCAPLDPSRGPSGQGRCTESSGNSPLWDGVTCTFSCAVFLSWGDIATARVAVRTLRGRLGRLT